MSIRLDQVAWSTLHEAPRNYDTVSAAVVVSGGVANGATANFAANLAYDRAGTRADVYLDGNSVKTLANVGSRAAADVYQPISTETFSVLISYSTTQITVTLSIFNGTGGPITLTTQTITVSAVMYDLPITAVS